MKPEEFIRQNIVKMLVGEGYTKAAAITAADAGVDNYHRSSGTNTKRRNIFDDCLDQARVYARLGRRNKARPSKARA